MMNKGNLSYGLNARSGGTGGNISSKGKKKKKGLSGFGGDDSDSSNSDKDTNNNNTKTSARSTINKEIQAEQEALRKRAEAAMAKSTSTNIEYNYDDEYDNFSSNKKKQDAASLAAKQKQQQSNNEPKQSRYINTLLKTAQRRNQEQEIIYEKQVQQEQSIEDPLYEGKDKFITSSYKRKLQEREQWSQQEKERNKREEANDVTKKGKGMGNFMFSGIGRSMLVGSGKDTVDIHNDMDFGGDKLGGLKKESGDIMDRGGEESGPRGTEWDSTKRSRDNGLCNDDDYTNRKRPPQTFGESNMGSDNINSNSTNGETKKDPQNTVKTRKQVLEERAIKIREARERYFQRRGITTSQ